MRSLVHSRMLDRLAPAFFTDRVTIEEDAPTRTASGAETHAWTAIAGHGDIPASVSPMVFTRAGERRSSELIVSQTTHRIALAGSYPTVTSRMRAVVATGPHAGTDDILRPDRDSQSQTTVREARIVVPVAAAGV